MTEPLILTGSGLTPAGVVSVARDGREVDIAAEAMERMAAGRAVVERYLAEDRPAYGLTTGLGPRVTHRLTREEVAGFSRMTVLGRSTAVGPPLPIELVRALMVARLNGLATGASGASPALASLLADCLNARLHPVIPSIGSVGAGDLCLLAHLGLALIGEGEFLVDGQPQPAARALAEAGLAPLGLGPKDGIAVCNASSAAAGQAVLALHDTGEFLELAQAAAALSMEGFRANLSPLDARLAAARPAAGQQAAAAGVLALLACGALTEAGAARRLQDPISFRCVAQVHGSLHATLANATPVVDAELNGAADNPLVLPDDDEILSSGNFHTPALALAMETLAQALAQVAALSVSRSARLLSNRLTDLPPNLSPHAPAQSGFAPLMKTADALLAEIRHRTNPAPMEQRYAADGVEDDITHAFFSARKAAEIVWRARLVLAIEFLIAAQAVHLVQAEKLGVGTVAAYHMIREVVPPLDEDRPLGRDVEKLEQALLVNGRLVGELRAVTK